MSTATSHLISTAPSQADTPPLSELVTELLRGLGEDPTREGLVKTPERVERSLRFLTSGNDTTLEDVVNGAVFQSDYRDVVQVQDIDVFSLCEHHLLPFYGKAHVAYVPAGRVIGLSKLPRIVEMYARRLQLQENLTQQVADAVQEVLKPRGVAVALECSHMCMAMRGVQKVGSTTATRALNGDFRTDPELLRQLGAGERGASPWGV